MSKGRVIAAAVSGSFHRHIDEIKVVVRELKELGVHVLSPADPTIVGQTGEFIFVASDRVRSIRLVQDRHLESIASASFVWLVCPDGYVGQSAAMEVGFAAARGVKVFAATLPTDLTLRQYVERVPDLSNAVTRSVVSESRGIGGFLIDPHATIAAAHTILDDLTARFNSSPVRVDEVVAQRIRDDRRRLAGLISLET